MLFRTLGCSPKYKRESDNFRQSLRDFGGTWGHLGGTPKPSRVTTSQTSVADYWHLQSRFLHPYRIPGIPIVSHQSLSSKLSTSTSTSTIRGPPPSTAWPFSAPRPQQCCRRVQTVAGFTLSPERFPAAGCCSIAAGLLPPLSRPPSNPVSRAPPANFLALARLPETTSRTPVSNLHHWTGYPHATSSTLPLPVFHFHLPVSSSFFPSCSLRIPTPRSIDQHVGNKTLSRCRAVEGRSFLSSHSVL